MLVRQWFQNHSGFRTPPPYDEERRGLLRQSWTSFEMLTKTPFLLRRNTTTTTADDSPELETDGGARPTSNAVAVIDVNELDRLKCTRRRWVYGEEETRSMTMSDRTTTTVVNESHRLPTTTNRRGCDGIRTDVFRLKCDPDATTTVERNAPLHCTTSNGGPDTADEVQSISTTGREEIGRAKCYSGISDAFLFSQTCFVAYSYCSFFCL